jgi:hypothetical protein
MKSPDLVLFCAELYMELFTKVGEEDGCYRGSSLEREDGTSVLLSQRRLIWGGRNEKPCCSVNDINHH